jgi:hypothetical protein
LHGALERVVRHAGVEHRHALFEPSADGAVDEIALGLAVAGIVEARHGAAMVPRP